MEPNPARAKEARLCTKDVARKLNVSVDTIKRRSRLLNILPTFPGHAANLWSETDVHKLERRWQRRQRRLYLAKLKT